MPRLRASGGRSLVFREFSKVHLGAEKNEYIAMWIDSEEPMDDITKAWHHLANVKTVPKWQKPKGAKDDQVLFMTTCMETYIVADREVLEEHYGSELQASALPPVNATLEQRSRQEVQDKLQHATRKCSNAYEKGKRSFEILGKLTPDTLAENLPSFVRSRQILNAKL